MYLTLVYLNRVTSPAALYKPLTQPKSPKALAESFIRLSQNSAWINHPGVTQLDIETPSHAAKPGDILTVFDKGKAYRYAILGSSCLLLRENACKGETFALISKNDQDEISIAMLGQEAEAKEKLATLEGEYEAIDIDSLRIMIGDEKLEQILAPYFKEEQ